MRAANGEEGSGLTVSTRSADPFGSGRTMSVTAPFYPAQPTQAVWGMGSTWDGGSA
eukprot:gene11549-60546_t